MFSIKKCGATDCTICKPPPKEIFDTIHHLSDPVRNGDVYKKNSDVYGTSRLVPLEDLRPVHTGMLAQFN